jgi:hypothetical protein
MAYELLDPTVVLLWNLVKSYITVLSKVRHYTLCRAVGTTQRRHIISRLYI